MKNLINKKVTISNAECQEYGNWGIVKSFDGEYYHIAMNGGDCVMIYERNEFVVKRSTSKEK